MTHWGSQRRLRRYLERQFRYWLKFWSINVAGLGRSLENHWLAERDGTTWTRTWQETCSSAGQTLGIAVCLWITWIHCYSTDCVEMKGRIHERQSRTRRGVMTWAASTIRSASLHDNCNLEGRSLAIAVEDVLFLDAFAILGEKQVMEQAARAFNLFECCDWKGAWIAVGNWRQQWTNSWIRTFAGRREFMLDVLWTTRVHVYRGGRWGWSGVWGVKTCLYVYMYNIYIYIYLNVLLYVCFPCARICIYFHLLSFIRIYTHIYIIYIYIFLFKICFCRNFFFFSQHFYTHIFSDYSAYPNIYLNLNAGSWRTTKFLTISSMLMMTWI